MDSATKGISSASREIGLAVALRKWQKRSRSRREPLASLAARLKTTVAKLRSISRLGPRKRQRRCCEKKRVLKTAVKRVRRFSRVSTAAAAEIKRETKVRLSLSVVQRLVSELRQENKRQYKKYWKKWHKQNPNTPISEEQMQSLERCSQQW